MLGGLAFLYHHLFLFCLVAYHDEDDSPEPVALSRVSLDAYLETGVFFCCLMIQNTA
jgi:hypothetical protein